jgi:hypothetical protein
MSRVERVYVVNITRSGGEVEVGKKTERDKLNWNRKGTAKPR